VDGTVSQQELDDAVQSNLANLATVASAKGKYDRSKASVTAAEAQIGVARSSLQAARLNLDFTKIRSPVNGIAGIHSARKSVSPRLQETAGSPSFRSTARSAAAGISITPALRTGSS
jgi:multidrug efflux pump subunit AcrA (membrane-fusion protein)